ncbi:MAG: DUF1592 domain-containing protein [Myxococcota bacterium]
MRRLASVGVVFLLVGCQGSIAGPGAPPGPSAEPSVPPPGDLRQSPDPESCALPAQRLWPLTPTQLTRTVAGVFGVSMAADDLATSGTSRFSNHAGAMSMTVPRVESLFGLATATAEAVEARRFHACLDASDERDCVESVVDVIGARAFRRPLRDEERSRYADYVMAEAAIDGIDLALEQLVRVLWMSPHFLHRFEVGEAVDATTVALDSFERAAALSYYLLDGPPDEALRAAAEAGELSTREQLRAHAERLMEEPRAVHGVHQYFDELFHPDAIVGQNKDEDRFPDFDESIAMAMAEETRAFVQYVLFEDDARFETLLTAPYTLASERLAEFYGLADHPGGDTARVPVDSSRRAGILGQGSFLASHATFTDSHIIERGRFVREEILCGTIPPPPPEVTDEFPMRQEGETQRAFLEDRHSNDSTCVGCHRLMDPLGFAFEHFDAVGRYRTEDVGQPIDASGQMVDVDNEGESFVGQAELAARLAAEPQAAQCMVKHLHEYGFGQEVTGADACSLYALNQAFTSSNGSLRELILGVVVSDAFTARRQLR